MAPKANPKTPAKSKGSPIKQPARSGDSQCASTAADNEEAPTPSKRAKKTAVQLPVRKIELQWRRARGANEEERELEDYLTEKGDELDLPDATMDCVGDLCTHEPEEFRNIIRLQYRCDELKMQISRISITIIPDKKTGDEANGIEVYDLIDGDWDYIRESVESTSQTIVIHVRLCLLGDGEPLMEWTGNHPVNDDEDEEMSSDQGSTGSQTNEFVASVGRIKLALPSRPKRQDS